MTWSEIARKDFADAVQARWLWILSAITVLGIAAPIVLTYYLEIGRLLAANYTNDPTVATVTNLRALGVILFPLLSIVMSYAAITREREEGSLKVLLSLPHSRRDVVVGKFVGRSLAVALPVALAVVVGAVLLAGLGGLGVTGYAVFGLSSLALVVTMAGVGVGLSARMGTTRRAILASVAAFTVFFVFWNPIAGTVVAGAQGLLSALGTDVSGTTAYAMENLARLANPFEAYKDLLGPHSIKGSVAQGYPSRSGSAPIYLKAPYSILVLLAWTVGTLLVGIRHFERVDL